MSEDAAADAPAEAPEAEAPAPAADEVRAVVDGLDPFFCSSGSRKGPGRLRTSHDFRIPQIIFISESIMCVGDFSNKRHVTFTIIHTANLMQAAAEAPAEAAAEGEGAKAVEPAAAELPSVDENSVKTTFDKYAEVSCVF